LNGNLWNMTWHSKWDLPKAKWTSCCWCISGSVQREKERFVRLGGEKRCVSWFREILIWKNRTARVDCRFYV